MKKFDTQTQGEAIRDSLLVVVILAMIVAVCIFVL